MSAAVSLDAAHDNAPAAVHALRLEHVSRRFGAVHAVQPMSLAVQAGERRALLGANGAGKTTLFNVIAGDLQPSTGKVLMFGEDVTRLSTDRRVRLGRRRAYGARMPVPGGGRYRQGAVFARPRYAAPRNGGGGCARRAGRPVGDAP